MTFDENFVENLNKNLKKDRFSNFMITFKDFTIIKR